MNYLQSACTSPENNHLDIVLSNSIIHNTSIQQDQTTVPTTFPTTTTTAIAATTTTGSTTNTSDIQEELNILQPLSSLHRVLNPSTSSTRSHTPSAVSTPILSATTAPNSIVTPINPTSKDESTNTSVVTPFLASHLNDQSVNISNKSINNDNNNGISSKHKFCYRHNPNIRCNKISDASKMTEIQSQLEKLPRRDQEAVSHVWSIFSAAPTQHRTVILQGLLSQCCFPQLSLISQEVATLIKIDFIETLPSELSLKILCYLDCQSLCNAAQVSTKWKQLADDDRVWRYMCEQHIDRKCPQCGWGLPLMAVKKLQESSKKRKIEEVDQSQVNENSVENLPPPLDECQKISKKAYQQKLMRKTRPWKAVYSERYTVERNWRKGIYSIKKFEGHKDGVLCCQYDNNNLLMTGSYDNTIKIWNVETGKLLRTLNGHTRGVRTLVFDDQKLITGGLDCTIKVWNYRTGQCISTYTGHEEGVVTVDFHEKVIVSGSADHTVKVWHVETRTCYTLRGHTDWVTCVKIHPKSSTVFSASDDSTVRMWDLNTNECLRVFGGVENNGHIGQVQCVIPFTLKDTIVTDLDDQVTNEGLSNNSPQQQQQQQFEERSNSTTANFNDDSNESNENANDEALDPNYPTHLLTASLDNTIKLWDVKTGKCVRTQFGHIEGVWSIAADTFRIVSGAHDKLVKVWDLQTGKCMHTFGGSSSPVSCVALGDSRFACGLENGEVKMYCFDCC